jgi:hypothetical protein
MSSGTSHVNEIENDHDRDLERDLQRTLLDSKLIRLQGKDTHMPSSPLSILFADQTPGPLNV